MVPIVYRIGIRHYHVLLLVYDDDIPLHRQLAAFAVEIGDVIGIPIRCVNGSTFDASGESGVREVDITPDYGKLRTKGTDRKRTAYPSYP